MMCGRFRPHFLYVIWYNNKGLPQQSPCFLFCDYLLEGLLALTDYDTLAVESKYSLGI